jgi:hypothetical protein
LKMVKNLPKFRWNQCGLRIFLCEDHKNKSVTDTK